MHKNTLRIAVAEERPTGSPVFRTIALGHFAVMHRIVVDERATVDAVLVLGAPCSVKLPDGGSLLLPKGAVITMPMTKPKE